MNHLWHNKGYLFIRNNYLIPRIKYGVPSGKLEHWKLKSIILQDRITHIEHIGSKKFTLSFETENYYKSIYSEIELFFNKSFIQLKDYNSSMINNISGSWSLVTLYYFLFFNICCFMRFFGRGYVYLSKQHTKHLEEISQAWGSDTVKIDAKNYFFKKISDEYSDSKIEFKPVDTTHKVIWSEFKSLIQLIIPHTKEEELAIYDSILSCLTNNADGYPSALRNDLNYNSESSLQDLSKAIPKIVLPEINSKFYQEFLKLSARSELNFESKIKSMAYISSYLYKLNHELSHDFYARSNHGKDMKNKRKAYAQ